MSSSVVFQNVTKKYKMYRKTSDKLLDIALPSGYGKDFYALQDVSFKTEKGDVIGVIGINGSGKSTLSNLISGVIPPTDGNIDINGQVSLISIATGLNNQLSGRENIELKCLMLGFSKQEIADMMPEIIDFADIGDFIDQPVKKYSSGMKSRLGFAISVTIDPDILVIDEALSVGDKTFADKSLAKMNEFKERGKTIFFISHSIGQIKEFCQKALWLEAGEIKAYGTIEEVVPQYEKFINDFKKMSKQEQEEYKKKLNERRSKKKDDVAVKEQEDNDNNNDNNDETKNNQNQKVEARQRSSSNHAKKHKRRKSKFWLIGILFVALLGTGIALGWDKLMATNQPAQVPKVQNEVTVEQEPPKINTEEVQEPDIIEEKLDLRYVNVPAANVRDMPELANSNRMSMVYFGQPILVLEVKKDPVEDMNWLKFMIQDDIEVWLSEDVVTTFDEHVDEDELIGKVGTQFNLDLSNVDELFTTDEEFLEEEESTTYTFDQDGYLSEVSYSLPNSAYADAIVSNMDEPHLINDEQTMLLYHGKKYDFVFYAVNSSQLNTLVVRPVIQDKEAVVELDLIDENEESEETQVSDVTGTDSSSSSNETEQVTATPTPPRQEEKPKQTTPKPTSSPKKTEEPTKPKPKPKPEEPKEPEQPAEPTPAPTDPPEEPVVPEEPTPDPTTPSEP
ncbi:teichoic acids export ABC transporter ATP-binding subunit TagH [Bacillus sp. JJ1533]|uniref:teichoic acids export ABC transporter ATP-binding subunit TagH n=1 Tax=Bacillus sp. JJ1533 TaxID=3122959 RepID=UPI003F68BA1F